MTGKMIFGSLAMMVSSYSLASQNLGFVTNIDRATIENKEFRKVIFTGPHSQLVVMSLKEGEDIGRETHKKVLGRPPKGEGEKYSPAWWSKKWRWSLGPSIRGQEPVEEASQGEW